MRQRSRFGREDVSMSLDPNDAEFWQPQQLDTELRRVFDICHSCRMCFNLCPAFPALFDAVDEKEEEVAQLTTAEMERVEDYCFQCKLCYVKCPYTPPHDWMIDFPRLMLRHKAVKAKARGVSFQDKVLGNTDLMGKLSCTASGLVNWVNRTSLGRAVFEKFAGIHRHRVLPTYASQPFTKWFAKRRAAPARASAPEARVALFVTCSVNYNNPEIGKAAVAVLERNNIEVRVPPQECCGMPLLDGGAIDEARAKMRRNAASLAQAVRDGCTVVAPGPTCSYVLKQEAPHILGTDEARFVAENTRDLCEYLMQLHEQGALDTQFEHGAGVIAYHLPCHLRAQNIGYKSRDLMQLLPATQVQMIEECSGIDGTWGLKKEYFEASNKVARKLVRGIDNAEADHVATDCPLSRLQIEQGTGCKARHPVEIIAEGYGIDLQQL